MRPAQDIEIEIEIGIAVKKAYNAMSWTLVGEFAWPRVSLCPSRNLTYQLLCIKKIFIIEMQSNLRVLNSLVIGCENTLPDDLCAGGKRDGFCKKDHPYQDFRLRLCMKTCGCPIIGNKIIVHVDLQFS